MVSFLSLAACLALALAQPAFSPALPTAGALRYASWNLTMFVHFSITTFTGTANGTEDPARFAPPADFTMDTWLDAAVALGAPVAVLTAKHEAGFVLWQTATPSRAFSVAASPTVATRDLVAEFVAACAARGVLPGLYFTTTDAWAHAHLNSSAAAAVQMEHLAELLARHGADIAYWWFDHHNFVEPWPTIDAMVQAANPAAVVLGLHTQQVGAELGAAPYPLISPCFTNGNGSVHGRCISNDLGAPLFKSPENDYSIIGTSQWFWTERAQPLAPGQLVALWEGSVGRGAGLILNVPPNTLGSVNASLIAAAAAMSAGVAARYGAGARVAAGSALLPPGAALVVSLPPGAPPFACALVGEDVAAGQLIAAYALDVCASGASSANGSSCASGWAPWPLAPAAAGATVGLRNIACLAAPVAAAAAVRLRVIATAGGLPARARLELLRGAVPPPRDCAGAPPCGALLSPAGAAQAGVAVRSNGPAQCLANNGSACCNATAGAHGCQYDAVELAQRWMAARYGAPAQWPGVAAPGDMCAHLPPDMALTPSPAAGDLMVIGAPHDAAGRVGVVSAVAGGTVAVYEQNGDVSGAAAYSAADAACFISGAAAGQRRSARAVD
jgi:alpha-L-fucosidase